MLILYLIIVVDSHNSKTCLIGSITSSKVIYSGHLQHQICITTGHSFNYRYDILLIISIRTLFFFVFLSFIVRIDPVILMCMSTNDKIDPRLKHSFMMFPQHATLKSTSSDFTIAVDRIMRHRYDKLPTILSNNQLFLQLLQRNILLLSLKLVKRIIRIKRQNICISINKTKCFVVCYIVLQKSLIQENFVILEVVVMITRYDNAWNPTEQRLCKL